MKSVNKGALLAAIVLVMPGCAAKQWAAKQYGNQLPPAPANNAASYTPEYGQGAGYAPVAPVSGNVQDFPVKVGNPYDVGGTSYTPDDNPLYDDVGYASWYGQELSGRQTANGEMFNPAGISAAHKTLPLPSYVEVTRLDTGKTILVRVNDRGPFANDRVIDLSEGAARQLGIMEQGSVGVRVRRVTPPESERAMLRSGRPVSPRLDTPGELLGLLNNQLMKLPRPMAARVPAANPRPIAQPATRPVVQPNGGGRFIVEGPGQGATSPDGYGTSFDPQQGVGSPSNRRPTSTTAAPSAGGYVVQVAAFSSRARADELASRLGAKVAPSEDGSVYRVRLGPYRNEGDAQKALEMVQSKGYSGARVFAN